MKSNLTFFMLSLTTCSLLAEGDTYLLSSPNMREWQPPVKTKVVLPERDVVESTHSREEGRHVCVEECIAPLQEPHVETTRIADIAEYEAYIPDEEYVAHTDIFISATVYMEGDKPFSHVRLQCGTEKIEVWSSMNFMEFAGITHYMARGIEYFTHLGHGLNHLKTASEAGCPIHRKKLNKNKARFLVVGEKDKDSAALEAMRGIHALYNKSKPELAAAYQVRLANWEKIRAWEKANPPKPEDITIQFWESTPNKKNQ